MFRKLLISVCIMACLIFTASHNSLSAMIPPKKTSQSTIEASRFILKSGDRKWVLNLDKIGFDGVDPTTLNKDLFMNWFYQVVERQINRGPRPASFRYRALVPHALGVTVNSRKVEDWLNDIHSYLNRPIEVPTVLSTPEVTTEKALALKGKLLASYTTRFSPYSYSRNMNIKLSGYAIDHYIVRPGEIFSFNEVIGRTTSEKGYRSARIIVRGEYQKGLGGGICQTSSTLYNCADRAGLKIIERWSHSKRVTYVPRDRDASVSWGSGDFKFQNQLNEPILIVSDILNGRIRISIYGPDNIHNDPRYVPPAPAD